jgi:uncharacterized membrane protein YozB (DUF420 family)
MTVQDLPAVNASLNTLATILLVSAFVCIKRRRIRAHVSLMIAAVATSAAFLACYVTYHFYTGHKSSGLPAGMFKTAYLAMLFSHIVLAVVIVPMVLITLYRAWRRDWVRHRRIATPTFWLWLYVSVTGVLIYLALYHLVPAMYPERPT